MPKPTILNGDLDIDFKQLNLHKPTYTILLAAVFFVSCKKENRYDCVKGTGVDITETRNHIEFDKLYVEGNVNVFLTQDSIFEVKVEAGKKIIDLIKTEVRDNTLYIKDDNRCKWTRSYKRVINVYIKMPIITYITSGGTGNIKGENSITTSEIDIRTKASGNVDLMIDNKRVTTHMHGSGDVTLTGKTGDHGCDIGGAAFLQCKSLKTNFTYIRTHTSGNSYVTAYNKVECHIIDLGDVFCYGNPTTVEIYKEGEGNLYLK